MERTIAYGSQRLPRRKKWSADGLEVKTNLAMQDSKTDQDESYRSYKVNFKIPRCLTTYTEPDDYVLDVFGEITCTDESGNGSIAGTVQGYIIQVDRIINDGESLFDACDAHGQTVHDYACVLFDFRSGELKPAIEDQFGIVVMAIY
jgi:hypothetical protein